MKISSELCGFCAERLIFPEVDADPEHYEWVVYCPECVDFTHLFTGEKYEDSWYDLVIPRASHSKLPVQLSPKTHMHSSVPYLARIVPGLAKSNLTSSK